MASFDQASQDIRGHLVVAVPFSEPTAALDNLRTRYPNLKITFESPKQPFNWGNNSKLSPEFWKDVTILMTLTEIPLPEDAPKLELLHVISAGTNHLWNLPIWTGSETPITTSSGVHGPTIAEWVVMTTLVASRKYNELREWQLAHDWSQARHTAFTDVSDNVGKRLGILGYGSIGRQVGRLAKAMGMDVIVFTAHPRDTPESKRDNGYIVPGTGDPDGSVPSKWFSGLERKDLHHFLGQDIDQLLVSIPLTKATKHLLGKEEFEILAKKNAFVINVARGDVIVQQDLIEALEAFENDSDGVPGAERKGLKGAALDVTTPEPLPKDSPLWDAPNAIITPHMSGINKDYMIRALGVLELNLERMAKGEKLANVVSRESGYSTKVE